MGAFLYTSGIFKAKLHIPTAQDGLAVNRLVAMSPPLDTNSTYCNLLQCCHFCDSSVIAKTGDGIVGFISGYLIPNRANTLFIWQVVVGEHARGQGLAIRMLRDVVERKYNTTVNYIETTITKDNEASWALFRKLATELNAELNSSVEFDKITHFQGHHDTEHLVRIGPLLTEK